MKKKYDEPILQEIRKEVSVEEAIEHFKKTGELRIPLKKLPSSFKNKEYTKYYRRKYYEKNKGIIKERNSKYRKKYYEKNKKAMIKKSKEYYEKNKGVISSKRKERYARTGK